VLAGLVEVSERNSENSQMVSLKNLVAALALGIAMIAAPVADAAVTKAKPTTTKLTHKKPVKATHKVVKKTAHKKTAKKPAKKTAGKKVAKGTKKHVTVSKKSATKLHHPQLHAV
jgi:hypothetical protein